ncbi:MAG: YceI family protein [Bacteroidia bacterium]|nr:YceI family protein [Bacteroidia bacterium]
MMIRSSIIIFVLLFLQSSVFAQKYIGKSGDVHFFSTAPLEDIEASTTKINSLLDTETGEIAIIVTMNSFEFEKSLMQEHFNEKYLETHEYRFAVFKGKVNEKIDYMKNGEHKVTCTGMLKLHGVEKEYTVKGGIKINDDSITYSTKFNVRLEDHDIKIPKIVFQNIAEVVEVSASSKLSEYVKNKK